MLTSRHAVNFAYTRPGLDALFQYARDHDVERGGCYDARSACIILWSHWLNHATRQEPETIGAFYVRWTDPPTLWKIETDEGFTREDLMAELGRLELQALGYVKHGDVPNGGEDLMSKTPYATDFYAWVAEQAEHLRAKRWEALDLDHLIEELDTLGRSERNALWSHLRILLVHLLKWRYQPERRTRSWRGSITRARQNVVRRLQQPSLRRELPDFIIEAYADARRLAADQTGLPLATFPERCEWSEHQVQDVDFFPKAVGEDTP